MDNNLATAIVTGGFTSLVGIFALVVNSKRMDDMRGDIRDFRDEMKGFRVSLDLLIGATHELDKRLSVIEDRIGRGSNGWIATSRWRS